MDAQMFFSIHIIFTESLSEVKDHHVGFFAELRRKTDSLGGAMSLVLTKDQQLLQEKVRKFAEEEVAPRLDEIIECETFIPRDLYKRMAELGLTGLMANKEKGGAGLGVTEMCIVVEELSKVAPTLGLVLMSTAPALIDFQESQEFCDRYMEGILNGDYVISGAVTAPEGHTNVSEWQVFAKKVDGGYLLNGTKLFITNSYSNDVHYVYGLDEDRHMRIFVIDGDAEGFTHDAHEVKFGMKGSGGGTCTYKDVFCDDGLVFDGEVGDGSFYNTLWAICSSIALGAAEGALAETIDYANTRTFNFRPIGAIQAQAQRIAGFKVKELAAHSLLYDAATLLDTKDPDLLYDANIRAQASKVFVPDMACEVTRECIKLHGGLGYSHVRYYHYFTEAVATMIMDQTTEFILESIAHMINLPEDLY